MGFYDLSKDERIKLVKEIQSAILEAFKLENNTEQTNKVPEIILLYAADNDTYIRKTAYTSIGRIYFEKIDLRPNILVIISNMLDDPDYKVRQTAVYSLGEIGKKDAGTIMKIFERALEDEHHSVRNAVIGSMKQMGQKNPKPTLKLVKKYLHSPNPQIRREMIHGIELRGRTHPEDVLPLLKELECDDNNEVRNMVVHVAGQISYKDGCLEKVIHHLNTWENRKLVTEIVDEILDVHKRYQFASKSPEEAQNYIKSNLS
jgi:HEAT repeat protein